RPLRSAPHPDRPDQDAPGSAPKASWDRKTGWNSRTAAGLSAGWPPASEGACGPSSKIMSPCQAPFVDALVTITLVDSIHPQGIVARQRPVQSQPCAGAPVVIGEVKAAGSGFRRQPAMVIKRAHFTAASGSHQRR